MPDKHAQLKIPNKKKVISHEQQILKELLNLEEGLTQWEVNFIESLSHTRFNKWNDKQKRKLVQIYENRC